MLLFEKEELEFVVFMARPKKQLIEDVTKLKREISELESDLSKVGNETTINIIKGHINEQKHYVYKMEGAIKIQEKHPSMTSIELKRAMREQRSKEARAKRDARLEREKLNKKGKDK